MKLWYSLHDAAPPDGHLIEHKARRTKRNDEEDIREAEGNKDEADEIESEVSQNLEQERIVGKSPYEESKLDSDDDDDDDIDESLSWSLVAKKKSKKCSKNKSGRKAKWSESLLRDLVDIVISNDYYKTKLILTNTKNQKNGEIYKKVLVELKERAAVGNEEVPLDHVQWRTKFKKAIAECKKMALTIKNSTRIKRFIEEKGYGPWFNGLFAIVKLIMHADQNLQ